MPGLVLQAPNCILPECYDPLPTGADMMWVMELSGYQLDSNGWTCAAGAASCYRLAVWTLLGFHGTAERKCSALASQFELLHVCLACVSGTDQNCETEIDLTGMAQNSPRRLRAHLNIRRSRMEMI